MFIKDIKLHIIAKNQNYLIKMPKPLPGGKQPPIDAFAIYKTKVKWNNTSNSWDNPSTDGNDATYPSQLIVDYIVDLIFNPIDETGVFNKSTSNSHKFH